ncbi:hypothetical protein P7K49_020330 [Saguinus oedipus]|uniref:Uncharacterized protein n=1 Tax=Saguinus oedipus TaxID=9490 RepID=A0ABQ9UZW9_SAGOE|nr:hypothetical protein P7K49_020330 [Saguinus oedipus]
MATARPLADVPPTCRATSPNLNKDARITRRPDKDEDRDRLKVGESAGASATEESRSAALRPAATRDSWGSPEQAPGRAAAPGQRLPKDLTG